jgi:hypothetical protein
MDPSSIHPETSNLPRTPPASPQLEASALSGTPQNSSQPIIHEPPLEPETSPIQEVRNEVSINVCPFLFNKPSLIRQFFSFQDQAASPPSFSFTVDDLTAEKEMRHLQPSFVRGKLGKTERNPLLAAKRYPGSSQGC